MKYDVHTHFFTSGVFGKGFERLFSLLKLREALDRADAGHGGDSAGSHIASFLRSGLSGDGEGVLKELDAAAGEEMSYCPLMMDIEYMDDEAADPRGRMAGRAASAFAAVADGWKEALLAKPGRSDPARETVARWIGEAEERIGKAVAKADPPDLVGKESFDAQIETLTALKKRHPGRIFPFLGLDPRRDAACGGKLMQMVGDLVGRGKTFAGVKLYPPTGFSPTDPFLFDRGGFYDFAEKEGIPITLHFSNAGFGAMVDRVAVRGDVYDADSGEIVPASALHENGVVEFETSLVNIRKAISERIRTLNHPKLWAKALEAYPLMRLNLAHLGGFGQIQAYLGNEALGSWTRFAMTAVAKYANVYSDLSGWFERPGSGHTLADFASGTYAAMPSASRRKILYGSDYFILSLKDPDLGAYLSRFKAAFGRDWDAIAGTNPAAFLSTAI